jgi:hypothetical protein
LLLLLLLVVLFLDTGDVIIGLVEVEADEVNRKPSSAILLNFSDASIPSIPKYYGDLNQIQKRTKKFNFIIYIILYYIV